MIEIADRTRGLYARMNPDKKKKAEEDLLGKVARRLNADKKDN